MSRLLLWRELSRLPRWFLVRLLLLFMSPQRVVALLGPALGRLRMAFHPGRVRALRRVMAHAYGIEPDGARADRMAREWFLEQGRLGVESSVHNILPWERLAELAHIEGLEALDDAVANGRGLIMATAHYGTRLIPQSAFWARGYRIRELIFKPDPPRSWLWRRVLSRNMAEANLDPDRAMYVGEPHRLVRYLRRGGGIAIAADAPTPQGVPVNMLGLQVRLNPGPAKMARLSGASVFLFYPRRNADQTHTLHVRPLEFPEDDGEALQVYAQAIEQVVLEAPQGWRMWPKVAQARKAVEGLG